MFGPWRSALRAAALTDLHRDAEAEPELRLARSALAGRVPPRLAHPPCCSRTASPSTWAAPTSPPTWPVAPGSCSARTAEASC